MFSLTLSPVFILLIFGCQEINSCEEEVCEAHQNEPWSYGGRNGPDFWGVNHTQCNGNHQSPINIVTRDALIDRNLIFKTINYGQCLASATIKNDGHTVKLSAPEGTQIAINVGQDCKKYFFSQLHFHWGSEANCGSEHTINGKATELELHLVHTSDDGEITVVGVFLQVGGKNNPALNPIIEVLPSIRFKNEQTQLKSNLCLSHLLPRHKRSYYRYHGSLTTPECNEGVIWTLFPETVKISHRQLKEIRSLFSTTRDEESCPLVNNYRPVQPLNDRNVSYYPATRGGGEKACP